MSRDKHGDLLALGDEVYYYIAGSGLPGDYGFVIGVMSYAGKDEDVVCLATEQHLGMPINTRHLQRTTGGHTDQAMALRERYLKTAPAAFKPLPGMKDWPAEPAPRTMFEAYDPDCIPGN